MNALISGETNLGRNSRQMYRVYSLSLRTGRKLYQYTIATRDPGAAFDNTVAMSIANPSLQFVVERVAA